MCTQRGMPLQDTCHLFQVALTVQCQGGQQVRSSLFWGVGSHLHAAQRSHQLPQHVHRINTVATEDNAHVLVYQTVWPWREASPLGPPQCIMKHSHRTEVQCKDLIQLFRIRELLRNGASPCLA